MDIAYENVIPAYLESNQLIFEYENVGVYDSIIFPINTVNNNFKPEITVSYNIEDEKKVQKEVDEGKSSWRLDPFITAHFFINSHIFSKEITGDNAIKYENISLLFCDDSTAVLKINDQHTNIQMVYLKKLIKPDSTGIWTFVGYDTK